MLKFLQYPLISVTLGVTLFLAGVEIGTPQDDQIQLIATGNGRAIIEYNGTRLILSTSDPEKSGVRLIDADSNRVVLQIGDERLTLDSDYKSAAVLDADTEGDDTKTGPVIIWANSNGSFYADGKVNGKTVKFLVDTGADIVTFSKPQADRLGINYSKGVQGYASTASGIASLKTLKLHSISIGHIILYDVQVSVIMGRFPDVPLLGGTILNKLNMTRIGSKMELSKR